MRISLFVAACGLTGAVVCMTGDAALAGGTGTAVTIAGKGPDAVTLTGGDVIPGKVIPAHAGLPQMTTASTISAVVMKSPGVRASLLAAALPFVFPSSTPAAPVDIEAFWLQASASGTTMTQHVKYTGSTFTAIDFPGNYGPSASRGSFAVTAMPGAVTTLPIVTWGGGGSGTTSGSGAWALHITDLPQGLKEVQTGTYKFEPFSITPFSVANGVTFTIHGQLANTNLAAWSQAHSGGGQAKIVQYVVNGGQETDTLSITLNGLTIVSSSNDPVSGGFPPTFTAKLNARSLTLTTQNAATTLVDDWTAQGG
jgi:hypothetical protein